MTRYRWVGSHAYRDHRNDRVIESGDVIPSDAAERIADAHPHDVEEIDEDGEAEADDAAGAPFDPTERSVDEVEAALDDGDYSGAELDALAEAESADGDPRSTALDAIDAARE